MSDGLVSVVITTYYRNDPLRECIESVREQTYEPIEIVVVDGSGEGHAESAVSEDVTYVAMDEDLGPHAARSRGVEDVSGEYVQFVDDDDRLRPTKVARQVERLRGDDTAVGVVYCGYETEAGEVAMPSERFTGDVLVEVLAFATSSCQTSTMLARTALVREVAPFDHWWLRDDVTLMIELAQRTRFAAIDAPLVVRGDDDGGLSTRLDEHSPVENATAVVEHYADLYAEYPEARRRALAASYRAEARLRVSRNLYSVQAVRQFVQYVALSESRSPRDLLELVAISGGRPGWLLGRTCYDALARAA